MKRRLLFLAGAVVVSFFFVSPTLVVNADWTGGSCPYTPPQPISPGKYPPCFLTFTSDNTLIPHTSGIVSSNGATGNVTTLLTITNSGNLTVDVTVVQISETVYNSTNQVVDLGGSYFTPEVIPPGGTAQFPAGFGGLISQNVIIVYYVIGTAEVSDLKTQIATLQSQISSLETEVTSINSSLSAAKTNLTEDRVLIANLSSSLNQKSEQLSAARNNLTANARLVANLTATLNFANQQLSAAQEMLSASKAQLAASQGSLTAFRFFYLPIAVLISSTLAVLFASLYFRKRKQQP